MQHAAATKSDGSVSRATVADAESPRDAGRAIHAALADLAAWISTDEAARRAAERRRERGEAMQA